MDEKVLMQRMAVNQALTLIEKCAREAREMIAHADQLRVAASKRKIDVADSGVVAKLNGGARLPPSESQQIEHQAAVADQNVIVGLTNIFTLCEQLKAAVAG